MNIIPYLICFPFVAAVLLFLIRNDKIRAIVTYISVACVLGLLAFMLVDYFTSGEATHLLYVNTHVADMIMLVGEGLLMLLVIILSVKYKKYWVMLLSIIPTCITVWVELFGPELAEVEHICVDRLSVLMCMIIGIVGGLICVYAVGYMKGYHEHHTEVLNRVSYFIALLFVFLGAMFGLVLSESLIWIFFFWEITSICSFLLIGYTRSEEAVNNSFRALWMNLLGGFGFALAILYSALELDTVSLSGVVGKNEAAMIPVILLAFAALAKSAQFPFSSWLLGAMVAPTPSSALLHSATMVKAGCYLLLRISPCLEGQVAGYFISLIGAFTFLMASMLAISVSDGKKVLAYSTISNLGLIVTCAGVGTPGTIWAAIFLMIFHAVTKSMLFQCIGAIENSSHSRDIEDMDGLVVRLRKLAFIMILGIVGMYLAPFGMLIFKWAALKAFVDAGLRSILLVVVLAFGSATTLLYWTKWLCKLVSYNAECKPCKDITTKGQYFSLFIHAAFVVLLCFTFSYISDYFVAPFVESLSGVPTEFLSRGNLTLMTILIFCLFAIPGAIYVFTKNKSKRVVPAYISGVNRQGGRAFYNSYGDERHMELSNWYMEDIFGERKLLKPVNIISTIMVIVALASVIILALI
jgi:ech hydrogenase subunit A